MSLLVITASAAIPLAILRYAPQDSLAYRVTKCAMRAFREGAFKLVDFFKVPNILTWINPDWSVNLRNNIHGRH